MRDFFKIYILRLRDGQEERFESSVDPDFMDIQEEGLRFHSPIHVSGKAALSDETLVLTLSAHTKVLIPCLICNEEVEVEIKITAYTHTEEVTNIRSGVYDFRDLLRETILVELPSYIECGPGPCSKREDLKKYFSKEERL